MKDLQILETEPMATTSHETINNSRRNFLKRAGAVSAMSLAVIATSCKDDDTTATPTKTVDLGSGDVGILNYAYALEQLEAAFYIDAVAKPYANMSADELSLLTEIRDHEVIHRDFFKAALGSAAIPVLEIDLSSIDFKSRASVLGAAKLFEDTGVLAYNGAGKLIKDANYLLLAGKIVSVEARHAAAIRDLLMPLTASFAGDDIIDANGLDGAKMPSEILGAVAGFFKTKITGANLPA